MSAPFCMSRNCGSPLPRTDTPGSAAAGPRLCTACRHGVRANLIELPAIYEDCEAALLPRRNPALQRVSGSRPEIGIRLNEESTAARSSILSLLASWSALVADERAVSRPPHRHPAYLAAFLLDHLAWLLAHPAAGDFVEEVSATTARARRAVHRGDPEIRLGTCITPGCNAVLTARQSTRDSGRTRTIVCNAGHIWQPHQWLQLSRRIGHARNTPGPRRRETST